MTTVEQILEVATQFEKVGCEFAFLGGAVLQVLVTDRAVAPIRVTKDIDVLVDTPTRIFYTKLEEKLRSGGFKNDTSEGAPLCRYLFKGIVVDVMPTTRDVLGWESKWFAEALATAEVHILEGCPIKTLLAPYYLATKFDAFEGRGNRDFLCSQDFEDIVCLVNGRDELLDEIRQAPHKLRIFLERKIRECIQEDDFQNAVEGFLVTENEPKERMSTILWRFRNMANIR